MSDLNRLTPICETCETQYTLRLCACGGGAAGDYLCAPHMRQHFNDCQECSDVAHEMFPKMAQATRQVENPAQVTQASNNKVTERDLALLRELWEYCDNYGEAADDSSVGAIRALNFAEPLRQLIARLESKN